jgi:uncharacterized membrane protein YhaH (DUF805 family)
MKGFFEASAGVAGALIGLLFVAVSVTIDRLADEGSEQIPRVQASAALTAFSNALVVSLFSLLPGNPVGWTAVSVGIVGLTFVIASLLSVRRVHHAELRRLRDAGFLIGMLVIFVLEVVQGIKLIDEPHRSGAVQTLGVLVIVGFLIGIARAWELIGGPDIGLGREVRAIMHRDDDSG